MKLKVNTLLPNNNLGQIENMRDIKFKARNIEEKRMHHTESITSMRNDKITNFYGYWKDDVMIFLRYTGLKDKNGKEIYEGDIVYLAGKGNSEIIFPFIELYEAKMENDVGEILGNIYENSELLTQ